MQLDTAGQCRRAWLKLRLCFLCFKCPARLWELSWLSQLLSMEGAQWRGPEKAQKSQRHKKCTELWKKWVITETKAKKRDTAQLWNAHIEPRKEKEKPLLSDNNPPFPEQRQLGPATSLQLWLSHDPPRHNVPLRETCQNHSKLGHQDDRTPAFHARLPDANLTHPSLQQVQTHFGRSIESIVKGLALAFKADSWAL